VYNLFEFFSVQFSADFAVAFAISRLFRRARLPLEVLGAGVLKKLFPPLSTIRLLDLFPTQLKDSDSKTGHERETRAKKLSREMKVIINKYGLCYLLSSRLVGVGVFFCLYEMKVAGVDIPMVLEYVGLENSEIGDVLGSWAAAVVASAVLYPGNLYLTSIIAPFVGKNIRNK